MSQDIFHELEEGSESEDDPGTPVQSSGVSGSSHSVLSSPVKPCGKAPQTPKTIGSLISCHLCPKTYKTNWGYTRHMTEKHPNADEPSSSTEPSCSKGHTSKGAQQSQERYVCKYCNKSYKTRTRFLAHESLHAQQAANVRKPTLQEFRVIQVETVEKIVNEMLQEPHYGIESESKFKFLREFLSANGAQSQFINDLSGVICNYVCERHNKIFPMNQYEEAHIKLNTYLCDKENINSLRSSLSEVCAQDIGSEQAGRIISRFAFKLLDHTQRWVAQEMRKRRSVSTTLVSSKKTFSFNEQEERGFRVTLGNIFRAFYKKGKKSSSKLWQSQSACLKDMFVIGPNPMTTSLFLDKSNWFSGDDNCIQPSENAECFFKIVEELIQSKSENKLPSAHEISDEILANNLDGLNTWHLLSNNYFSEEDSILFMKELLNSYVVVSNRLQESVKNRLEEKSIRESSVALRTHLQKNFTEKVDSKGNVKSKK